MSKFEQFFKIHKGHEVLKWTNYPRIYEKHLNKFQGKKPTLLEIGIRHGGSLDMWNYYFDNQCEIYAIDILEECRKMEKDNIKVFIGDQGDRSFWQEFKKQVPKFDIIVDDGGHQMDQQIITFEELFDHLKPGGIYLCEDTHSSYMVKQFKAGHLKPNTFIEFAKKLADQLHAWFSEEPSLKIDRYTKNIECITFHNSIVVIEKNPQTKPQKLRTGKKRLNINA